MDEKIVFSEHEAAKFLGFSYEKFARNRRAALRGEKHFPHPPFVPVGAQARYLKDDLIDWLNANRVDLSAPRRVQRHADVQILEQ